MHYDLRRQNSALLERITAQAPSSSHCTCVITPVEPYSPSHTTYGDPNETRRKSRKAFSSHLSSKTFSGKFGNDCSRHCEDFVAYVLE